MRDSLKTENHHDFKQRYQDTFGFLINNDKRHLVHLKRIDSGQAEFVDVEKSNYYVYTNSNHVFEFIQVTRGWFNTKGGLYYLARVPDRQWKRGICAANTNAYRLTNNKIFSSEHISLQVLNEVFLNEISLSQARQEFLENKRPGFCIGKHFALTDKTFYFDNKIHGKVAIEKGITTITLKTPLVYQEVSDVIRRNELVGVTVTVEKQNV